MLRPSERNTEESGILGGLLGLQGAEPGAGYSTFVAPLVGAELALAPERDGGPA